MQECWALGGAPRVGSVPVQNHTGLLLPLLAFLGTRAQFLGPVTPGWGAPSSPGSPGAGVLRGIHGPCQVPLVPARSPGAPWHRVAPPGSALLLPRSAAAAWPGLDAPRGHGDRWVWAGGHGWSRDSPCLACNYSPAGGIAHETRARWGAGGRGASVCRHGCQSWPCSSWEGCGGSGPRPPQPSPPSPSLAHCTGPWGGGPGGPQRSPAHRAAPRPGSEPLFPPTRCQLRGPAPALPCPGAAEPAERRGPRAR